ncbi:MAG: hypothetical protein MJE66_14940, partial [Proteobacteria bacterium]|nr:hypothetical protein [Pseudomonadota bacterium]
AACGGGDGPGPAAKSAAAERAERRLYDGAPPVIPHPGFSGTCTECHSEAGVAVADVGFAPPTPHELTPGLGLASRCVQCHVYAAAEGVFRENAFQGLAQDLRRGRRLSDLSPPVMPHPRFMRENCAACHTGPAAREEIRTSHPERQRCGQCHVERIVTTNWTEAS